MFDLAGNDVKTAKDRWDEIVNILGNINMNNFLRHYWVSKFGIVSQKNLMNEFEKNINSKLDVFNFLDELKFEAEIYESIFNKSSEMWNKDIVILLDELFILTKNIVLPLLLGTLQTLEERYHKKFLSICISFIFRYLTIAERENKELESLFSKMSIDIRNGSLTTLGRIKERLLRIYVDDDTFEKIFMNKDIKTAKVARYILQKLESNLDPIQEKFSNRITLEHILPKNPNQEWIDYITSKKINTDKVVDKLGNMTLLLGKVNKIAQNKFFIEKRDLIYSKMTKLKINSDISKITSWTEAEVLERQSIFAKQAKKIWSI